jgi:UDP-N-acetylglucosamine--N-acetylmuramyl-(pentapeptide) pyrophosphoryl-undecaprenol N-acetylglucosamine transferase
MSAPVVLAAGGTGGHVFPAQALAGELLSRGHALALVTDQRGADYGGALAQIDRYLVRAGTLGSGGLGRAIGGLTNVVAGVFQARSLLRRLRPSAVIGFGGYPSLPTMIAAARLNIPAAIHEQNAVLGRANRLLASRVAVIATSFPDTRGLTPPNRQKAFLCGNPVRPEVVAARAQAYAPPQNGGPINILVTGGSQGASVLSDVVPAALAKLPAGLRARTQVTQQCRPEDLADVRRAYDATGIGADLCPFIEDLAGKLAGAHIAIVRAGASTVAELGMIGRPAVLVPYPHATDDHQTQNARALADAGAAWLMPQDGFDPDSLSGLLRSLFDAPGRLVTAATAARALGRPDAAACLADLVVGLAGANGGGAVNGVADGVRGVAA